LTTLCLSLSPLLAPAPATAAPSPASPAAAPLAPTPDDAYFSMLVASDTQLPWWREGDDPGCKGDDDPDTDTCGDQKAAQTNQAETSAMNRVLELGTWPADGVERGGGTAISVPKGIILNGDLTAYWHEWQVKLLEQYYAPSKLSYPPYLGLGNHDYDNNVDRNNGQSCSYQPAFYEDTNRCAKEAVWYMGRQLDHAIPNLVNRDWPTFVAVYNGAGFDVQFKATYNLAGAETTKESGRFPAGQRRGVTVPWGATNVRVKMEAWNGSSWLDLASSGGAKTLDKATTSCWSVAGALSASNDTTISVSAAGCPREWPDGTSGSAAYSFEIGMYHFVQLHNYPGYSQDLPKEDLSIKAGAYELFQSPGVKVTTSYDWLKKDLTKATAAGRFSVINMHEALDDSAQFADAITGQNVVAIFGGHVHQDYGYMGDFTVGSHAIPWFRSGSVECGTFLLADFRLGYFNVGVVNSQPLAAAAQRGTPAFFRTPTVCDSRITKYSTNSATTSTMRSFLLPNRAPQISGLPSTLRMHEGGVFAWSITGTDFNADALTYAWDFGDGAFATTQSVRHTYRQNGVYNVIATVQDSLGGMATHLIEVTVVNQAPQFSATGSTVDKNDIGTISGSLYDPGVDDKLTLAIEWGDGAKETQELLAGSKTFSFTHRYVDNPSPSTTPPAYNVKLTLTDDDGGWAVGSTTVTAKKAAPTLRVTAAAQPIVEGGTAVIPLAIADPDSTDSFALAVDWGDGVKHSVPLPAGTTTYTAQHQYLDNPASVPAYPVGFTLTDDDGGVGTANTAVTVANAAPKITATSDATSILEGGTVNLSGAIADPGSKDSFTLWVSWGDGTADTVALPAGTQSYKVGHTFVDNRSGATPSYVLSAQLTDKDGLRGNATTTVTVSNVPPTATFVAPVTVEVGKSLNLALTGVGDPSTADVAAGFSFAFDCGDGAGYAPASPASARSCAAPAVAGTRTVKGRLRDKDGGEREYTATLRVVRAVPVGAVNKVEVCEHFNYAGVCQTVVGNMPALSEYGLNDFISAMRITGTATVSVYENDNYQGRCETFTTSDARLDDNVIGNDVISSLRVGTTCSAVAAEMRVPAPPVPQAPPVP
jgi:hypothetical protein